MLDRIDIQIEVPALAADELQRLGEGEASHLVRARVEIAREQMNTRQGKPNALLEVREVEQCCAPDETGAALLRKAITKLGLSARSYHRTLKVARTIADLAGAQDIATTHVAEAIGYRRGLDS